MEDKVITRLFYSRNPDDWRLAAAFTIKKYKYKDNINEYFATINKEYVIRRNPVESTFDKEKVHIYCSKEDFVQIIVGLYGLYCKSLLGGIIGQYNNIIEWL